MFSNLSTAVQNAPSKHLMYPRKGKYRVPQIGSATSGMCNAAFLAQAMYEIMKTIIYSRPFCGLTMAESLENIERIIA
jgi:hypothetical protein